MGGRKKDAETVTLADHLRSIASKGGKARAALMTTEDRVAAGKLGGDARNANLSAERRSEIARAAGVARWGKKKKKGEKKAASKS
jgi:hypothetical protein